MSTSLDLMNNSSVSLQSQAIVIKVLDEQMTMRKVTLSFDNDNWFSLAPFFTEMKERLYNGLVQTIRKDEKIVATKADAFYLKNGIYVKAFNWQTHVKKDGEWQDLEQEIKGENILIR